MEKIYIIGDVHGCYKSLIALINKLPNKEKSKVNLLEVFKKTLDLISAQFNSKEIKIIKNIETIEFESYENELIQALINILNNSRDELIKKDDERFITDVDKRVQ